MALFWLSFCDDKSLGAAIVEGADLLEAIKTAHRLGINPGGQVLSVQIPPEQEEGARRYRNRLMQRPEIERIFGPLVPRGEISNRITRHTRR